LSSAENEIVGTDTSASSDSQLVMQAIAVRLVRGEPLLVCFSAHLVTAKLAFDCGILVSRSCFVGVVADDIGWQDAISLDQDVHRVLGWGLQ
jgi:hypothetical protein